MAFRKIGKRFLDVIVASLREANPKSVIDIGEGDENASWCAELRTSSDVLKRAGILFHGNSPECLLEVIASDHLVGEYEVTVRLDGDFLFSRSFPEDMVAAMKDGNIRELLRDGVFSW